MRNYGYLGCLGQMHRQVFKLGQRAVCGGLRLQDEASPQANDGKAVGLVPASAVDVERELCLHTRKRSLTAHHLTRQVAQLRPDIRQ